MFTAPPEVLHPGEGARILEPVVGKNSVILLDEGAHMSQRKLMLPAFHGERMQRLTGLVAEVAERDVGELAPQPADRAASAAPGADARDHPAGGVRAGSRRPLRPPARALTTLLEQGATPTSMLPAFQRGRRWARFKRDREEADALIFELIDERRRDPGDRDDVLAMLLEARHEDGSPMSAQELRDELMTLLVAGHETTASELAWAFERLARTPEVLQRLTDEIDRDGDDAYLTATVQETLRRRPVLPERSAAARDAAGRDRRLDLPGRLRAGRQRYLIHHDPAIYPDPYAFRPERFLEESPGTYTWIPFGGGRRRCLGASFAQLEMKLVLRAVLSQSAVSPASEGFERTRRRSITVSPKAGAVTVLGSRERRPAPAAV